jgi:prepilin-type N-terminal cleavage/methylation domain-containing protein
MELKQGFTLIEVVVALIILTASFTSLFLLFRETLNQTKISSDLWKDFVFLDTAYKLKNKTAVSPKKGTFSKFGIPYKVYQYKDLTFVELSH